MALFYEHSGSQKSERWLCSIILFNYKLRPQKCIERKLISELIHCVSNKLELEFSYVGLGSLYFTDFIYFHKKNHINKMKSIEYMNNDNEKYKRFRNNKPYNFIDLDPRMTSDVLPELNYDDNLFIWLDYDNNLKPYMLNDISLVSNSINETSIIAITINSNIGKEYMKHDKTRNYNKLISDFQEFSHKRLERKKFLNNSYYITVLDIMDSLVHDRVKENNFFKDVENQMTTKLISNIIYKDGAEMWSFIWLLCKGDDKELLDDAEYKKLKILNELDLTIDILTPKEKRMLERNNNIDIKKLSNYLGVQEDIIKKYREYYKYIPEYGEVDL